MRVGNSRMVLGLKRQPQGGKPAPRTDPGARRAVVSDGVELEPVWFPHRDAVSLLPADYPSIAGGRECGVSGVPLGQRLYRGVRERTAGRSA